jgi:hypothetical protein
VSVNITLTTTNVFLTQQKGKFLRTAHALILALGAVVAAAVFGMYFHDARSPQHDIAVTGYATMSFEADIVKWRVTLQRSTGLTDLVDGYRKIQGDVELFKRLLIDQGLAEEDISVQPINTYQNYGREGQVTGNTIQQALFVISSNIDAIETLALDPSKLIESGVTVQSSQLEFFSSKLADIKQQLLAEATRDAQKRAQEIVTSAGRTLGKVISLRSGVFQITEPYSTEVSGYGMYNTQTRQKDITVTVRASFLID